MGENLDNFQQKQPLNQSSSRLGSRSRGGEIVEVQGGHIVRSTGRKDRHSKVCTAKGPRDRRVRLSATTAIQFYDVQDRLGYDRPSKAVDWLMMKSKAAIDELAELPPWHPTSCLSESSNFAQEQTQKMKQRQISLHHGSVDAQPARKRAMTQMGSEIEGNPSGSSSSFLPPSLDSDSIADTIKSFFPMGASAEGNSSNLQFQSFQQSELLSRTSGQSQDLRLSLQSVQDPIFLHQNDHQAHHQASTSHTEQVQAQIQAHTLFSRANNLGFDVSGNWSEQQQQSEEIGRHQKLTSWNPFGDTSAAYNGGAAGGYFYSSQPLHQQQQQQQQQPLLQQLLSQSQLFSQRGPLQSSNSPSIRAWVEPSSLAISTDDHIHHHQPNQTVFSINPSSFSGIGFASGVGGGFPGFHFPARIQGEVEEHDGLSDKPSSASSDSRY